MKVNGVSITSQYSCKQMTLWQIMSLMPLFWSCIQAHVHEFKHKNVCSSCELVPVSDSVYCVVIWASLHDCVMPLVIL